jgi:ectoine hydroxylase-related dioxygenase (phytanoyl-CoA dioxygenase family)
MKFPNEASLKQLDENGFLILPNVLKEELASTLISELSALKSSNAVSRRNNSIYGVRNLLNLSPKICEFSASQTVRQIVEPLLGGEARLVRAIYFNKTAEANWKVPWHQDLTIAVRKRVELAGFAPWTLKADVWHVQPPIGILENMVTLRFHLDDANETNGALRVIPGSHACGRLTAQQIKQLRSANETVDCSVKKGDCLVMRPLLLHSSSAGLDPSHRRVIHFEFASGQLPNQLQWHES